MRRKITQFFALDGTTQISLLSQVETGFTPVFKVAGNLLVDQGIASSNPVTHPELKRYRIPDMGYFSAAEDAVSEALEEHDWSCSSTGVPATIPRRIPGYRCFKPKHLGLVVNDGTQHYLGKFGKHYVV